MFGPIVAQRESLLWDTAKRLNNIAQGREAHRRVNDQNQESTPKGLYKTVADDSGHLCNSFRVRTQFGPLTLRCAS